MSNFPEIMKVTDEADKLMAKVDESFQRMTRGGTINLSLGMTGLVGNLRHANKLFKKLDRLSKEGLDSYTDEEKKAIEEKAKALTEKYNRYFKLVEQANEIAKNMGKDIIKEAADTVKGAVSLEKKEEPKPETPKQEGEQ